MRYILKANKFNNKTLLEYAKYILAYDNDHNSDGFPYLIYSKIASEAPEVMFMLLYRLLVMKDLFDLQKDDKTHRRMLGMISLFLWLGKGENLRDHSKLLSNIWPAVTGIKSTELFWSSSTIQRAILNDVLLSFPSSKKLNPFGKPIATTDILSKDKDNEIFFRKIIATTDILSKDKDNEIFFRKIFFERDLILYAQRKALSLWFNDQHYDLDDTNVPFDWDHISPNKFCRNQKEIPKAVKSVYNSNGNLRAWPYSLNRFDQDEVPAKKLNPFLRAQNSPNNGAEGKINKLLEYLNSKYNLRLGHSKASENDLMKTLLEWSACSKDWVNCTEINLKNRKSWNEVFKLIMDRNITICNKWYQDLKIDSLIPNNTANVSKMFDKRRWKKCEPKYFKKHFGSDPDFNTCWLYEVGTSNNHLNLYFGYYSGEELTENGIAFGIVGNDIKEFFGKKPPRIKNSSEYDFDEKWIGSTFTLISNDESSYVELFANITHWLEKLPSKHGREFSSAFTQSISSKMQRALQLKKA